MHVQRRNPPGPSDIVQQRDLPVRDEMGDSRKKDGGRGLEKGKGRAADGELEGDPIVAELRKLYDGVLDEPLPDQLMELLRKLDEVERNR
jgi:hypothetical protein